MYSMFKTLRAILFEFQLSLNTLFILACKIIMPAAH